MDKKFVFNQDVIRYDNFRPQYCEQLFQTIFSYANLPNQARAIEVGIGTGQATRPFLDKGYDVTAIELGENLANYVSNKFKSYPRFHVHCGLFEEYSSNQQVDILYSATAFHWIDDKIGYPKAKWLLRQNGVLALFWNRPFVSKHDDPLHNKIQEIYAKFYPGITRPMEVETSKYQQRVQLMESYNFMDVQFYLFHNQRTVDANSYIALLNTYSDHQIMEFSKKVQFENEIREAIYLFGNQLTIYDTMELVLGRNPKKE